MSFLKVNLIENELSLSMAEEALKETSKISLLGGNVEQIYFRALFTISKERRGCIMYD